MPHYPQVRQGIYAPGYTPHSNFTCYGFYSDSGEEMPRDKWLTRHADAILSGDDDWNRIFAVDIDPQMYAPANRVFVIGRTAEDVNGVIVEAVMDPTHRLHEEILHVQDWDDKTEDYGQLIERECAILAVWQVTDTAQLDPVKD